MGSTGAPSLASLLALLSSSLALYAARARQSASAMDKPSGAPHRCYCLHSVPPPSEPSAASPSPSAAPLDLLDRRLWPLLLPAVGAAVVVAAATVVAPPQAASDQAGQPSVCAGPQVLLATPPPPSTPTAGRSHEPAAPLLCFLTRDLAQEFE
jgi:hypothetical protein